MDKKKEAIVGGVGGAVGGGVGGAIGGLLASKPGYLIVGSITGGLIAAAVGIIVCRIVQYYLRSRQTTQNNN